MELLREFFFLTFLCLSVKQGLFRHCATATTRMEICSSYRCAVIAPLHGLQAETPRASCPKSDKEVGTQIKTCLSRCGHK